MENTFCPIMTAGMFVNKYTNDEDPKDCKKEQCEMWDKERGTCGLKQRGEKKES